MTERSDEKAARRPCSCGITTEGMISTHRGGKRIMHVAYPAECWEMAEGHDFLPVAGHPDDNECTHREDGTDATYCGRPIEDHADVLDRVIADLASGELTAYATGWWCLDCEFFEAGEDMGDHGCHACGCRRDDHAQVAVLPIRDVRLDASSIPPVQEHRGE